MSTFQTKAVQDRRQLADRVKQLEFKLAEPKKVFWNKEVQTDPPEAVEPEFDLPRTATPESVISSKKEKEKPK